MSTSLQRVETALHALKQGKMVILVDHPQRENEGDLIIPAHTITPEQMNFMLRHTSGVVCVAMTPEKLQQLGIPLMVPAHENTSAVHTPFTLSVDAKHGISSGVSVADRIRTIRVLMQESAGPQDLVKPGHIFPLQANANGVLGRQGHTEGSVDLMKLAELPSAAVICELMNSDGSMMRGKQLEIFAITHDIVIVSIDDIIEFRRRQESMIAEKAHAELPLEHYGKFKITVFKDKYTGNEHVALLNERISMQKPPLVRIHSSCLTGDLFSSKRCDCHHQLHYALERISKEGGVLIYLRQEGRGIGLLNKIKAYALQEQGCDTVEANERLGFLADQREYSLAANILRDLNYSHIRLLTNNPGKVTDLQKYGISQIEREPMPAFTHAHNQFYLQTKKEKLQHIITFE